MAFPANLDTIVVRHKITDAAGRPLKGNTVTAEPAERVWATDGSIVQYRASTQIDANGQWELELPYVDQEGIRNKGVPWRVTEHVPGQPKSYFVAPVLAHGAGPIDAAECLVSAPTSRETVIQAGPVTDEAAASLLAQDGEFKAALMGTIGATVEEKAGNVPIFGSQVEAQAWEAAHPGLTALWFDAGYTEVTATGPTWTDDDINGGGTWTTPTQEGVVYSPASGTAQPGQTVTVNATAEPGHVLVGTKTWTHTFPVAATTQWFTDFTEYTVGQAPHDWSVRWATAVNHLSVVEDADATGGVMLREDYTSTAGQNRIASWDTIGEQTDVEAVMKWRTSSPAAPPRIALRASADVPRTAYHGGSQNGTTNSLQKLVAATSSTDIATASRSFESDTWYVTRMRTEGTRIAVKTWRADEPEPAAWDFDATDTSIPGPGLVGFRVFPTTGVRDFDWFGVGLNGQSAPTEPVGV